VAEKGAAGGPGGSAVLIDEFFAGGDERFLAEVMR
jgi:hypothetical protein